MEHSFVPGVFSSAQLVLCNIILFLTLIGQHTEYLFLLVYTATEEFSECS